MCWVLITGALRDISDFYKTLTTLFTWRDQGRVDGIVLSTWHDEIDRTPGLRWHLADAGVMVVESDPVPDIYISGMPLSAWRQVRQTINGLRQIPPGVAVFKTRTDKAHFWMSAMGHLAGNAVSPTPADHPYRLFGYRLTGLFVKTGVPVQMSDVCYYGHRDDLLPLQSFDAWFDTCGYPSSYCAEFRWLHVPLYRPGSLMATYGERVDAYNAVVALAAWARDGGKTPLPKILNAIQAWSHLFIEANLDLIDSPHALPPAPFAFHDLYPMHHTPVMVPMPSGRGPVPFFATAESFQSLMAGDILPTDAGAAYLETRQTLRPLGPWPTEDDVGITVQDWDELSTFMDHWGRPEQPVLRGVTVQPVSDGLPDLMRRKAVAALSPEAGFRTLLHTLSIPERHPMGVYKMMASEQDPSAVEVLEICGRLYRAGQAGFPTDVPLALTCFAYAAKMRSITAEVDYATLRLEQTEPLTDEDTTQIRNWLADAISRAPNLAPQIDAILDRLP